MKANQATEIAALEEQIRHHNKLYWDEAAPAISDTDYDLLVRKLSALAPDSPVLTEMGPSRAAALGTEFKHSQPMLSLDKCYERAELESWTKDFAGQVVAMPKYDGIACTLHYDAKGRLRVAATRGDGVVGDDITVNASAIADIPMRIPTSVPVEVRGEIYMRLSRFAKYRAEGMANPRNLAAGAVKLKDRAKSSAYGLSFGAYDILGADVATLSEGIERIAQLGFPRMDAEVAPKEQAWELFERFAARRASLDYEIDGVVFKVDSIAEQRRMGETAHHPRYAIAFKFQGDAGISTLLQVEWSVARTGAITPVAIVEPVNLSGVTVSRASLHNVAFIDKLGLSIGAKVTLVRRGGVIPNVENVTEPGSGAVRIPSACPSCGSPVLRERDFLYCSTPSTCRMAVIGQLAHFASTLDMLGFGDTLLEQAYDAGLLRSIDAFYSLRAEDLAKLERRGDKTAKKLVAEVDKKRSLDLAAFLRALGIAELGKNVSSILADRYRTLDAVLAVTQEELAQTHGIGDTIARAVVTGLADAAPVIGRLREHVQIAHAAAQDGASGPLSGSSFVFTGKMVAFARSEGEKRVRAKGGSVHSSVTKELTYLVKGADASGPVSSKEKAAQKLIAQGASLRILSEDELLAMLEG